eukprot:2883855-Rhodomonas_salina.2
MEDRPEGVLVVARRRRAPQRLARRDVRPHLPMHNLSPRAPQLLPPELVKLDVSALHVVTPAVLVRPLLHLPPLPVLPCRRAEHDPGAADRACRLQLLERDRLGASAGSAQVREPVRRSALRLVRRELDHAVGRERLSHPAHSDQHHAARLQLLHARQRRRDLLRQL